MWIFEIQIPTNIWCIAHANHILNKSKIDAELWKRYVDDIFVALNKSDEQINVLGGVFERFRQEKLSPKISKSSH